MKRFNGRKYWLKDLEVKESVSNRKVVENMIKDIGEKLVNDMMLEKYSRMVKENN